MGEQRLDRGARLALLRLGVLHGLLGLERGGAQRLLRLREVCTACVSSPAMRSSRAFSFLLGVRDGPLGV